VAPPFAGAELPIGPSNRKRESSPDRAVVGSRGERKRKAITHFRAVITTRVPNAGYPVGGAVISQDAARDALCPLGSDTRLRYSLCAASPVSAIAIPDADRNYSGNGGKKDLSFDQRKDGS
jgi:hypothetical protein